MQPWGFTGVVYTSTFNSLGTGERLTKYVRDTSLFSTVKDYLAVEKGWFSPYLFASGRRPIIPRTMNPDVVFCHGPFLSGNSLSFTTECPF